MQARSFLLAGFLPGWALLVALLCTTRCFDGAVAFSSRQLPTGHSFVTAGPIQLSLSAEYEYNPPNIESGSHDYPTTLPSVYPAGTPAGLRGEAVRTALRSTQCLAWKLASSPDAAQQSPNLACGVLQLEGKGTLDFLNNKLSNSFPASSSGNDSSKLTNFAQACLLTSKGRLVDTLAVSHSDTRAFVMPSPGHTGSSLFQKLDPFIFPMDQVKLKDRSQDSCVFTLASTKLEHVETAVQDHLVPKLRELILEDAANYFVLPKFKQSLQMDIKEGHLVVLPCTGLPDCTCVGYTFLFLGESENNNVGNQIWQHLIGENNPKGPVEVQALEYESLRIEAGQPAFGYEVTGAWKDPEITSPTPLELHQKRAFIDFDKGCYLGQEGIASVMKNPRGPPRSLYTVVFEDQDNHYQHQTEDGDGSSSGDNLTRIPRVGEKMYVLGSNEEIEVGTITSVAEPYATGESTIVGLALIRRPDSILKQMKAKDLQLPGRLSASLPGPSSIEDSDTETGSGMITPPPMDSLDGVEVIVGGTFTVGMLRGVPSRRFPKGKNMFVDKEQVFLTQEELMDEEYVNIEYSGLTPTEFLEEKRAELENQVDTTGDTGEALVDEPTTKTSTTDDKGEDEAQRKAAKMELLKQQAEEARARRRKKALEAQVDKVEDEDELAAEEKRKAEKMKLLQKRAEEAIARRRKKKETQG